MIKFPDPKKWTLQNLKAHNLEFVITKEAVAVHGFEQASVYPVIKAGRLKYPTSILVNESALKELGVTTLQDAVSPTAWKPVRGSEKYAFVIKDGQEHAIKQRGQLAEAVGKTLVVISILIETIFFALQWEHADNKIIHCAQYAANVGLIIGGYAACEAVSSAMITTGFSGLVSGLATFGIGLIFSGNKTISFAKYRLK